MGGLLVYCDHKSWPKNPEKLHLPEGWVVAVGVHPKHASDFGDYYFDRLSKLMDFPAVTALGEVGMDCSEGAAMGVGACSPIYASGAAYPGLGGRPRGNGYVVPGGIGLDAGESS